MTKIYAWLIAALTKLMIASVFLGGSWGIGFYNGFTFRAQLPQPVQMALEFLGGGNGNSR